MSHNTNIHDEEQVILDNSSGVLSGLDLSILDDVGESGLHRTPSGSEPRKAKAVARKQPSANTNLHESSKQTNHDGDTLNEIDASDLSGLLKPPSISDKTDTPKSNHSGQVDVSDNENDRSSDVLIADVAQSTNQPQVPVQSDVSLRNENHPLTPTHQSQHPQNLQPVHVPVPQFVPVPVASPDVSQNPQESKQKAPTVDDSTDAQLLSPTEFSETGRHQEKKRPAVRQTPSLAGQDDSDAASSMESSDHSSSASASRVQQHRLNKKQGAFQELFLNAIHSAESELQKKQEPTGAKHPKSLERISKKLAEVTSSDHSAILKHLKAAGNTRHAAAVDIFRDYSTHSHKDVRICCVNQLERMATPEAGLALLRLLQDKTSEVASGAARVLLTLEYPETLRPVLAFAVLSVVDMPVIREALESESDEEKAIRARHLSKFMREPVDVPEFQAFALHLISRLQGPAAIKLYQKCLAHPVAEVRASSIEALAATQNKRCVSLFNRAMADPSPLVQTAAAEALAILHSPKSIGLLVNALASESASVRRAAAATLCSKEDSDGAVAAAASKAVQTESDQATMESLLEIIGRGGTEEAVGTLKRLAHGDDLEARYRAIQSLKKVKGEKSVRVLMPLLQEDDAKTRKQAVDALGRLQAVKALPEIRKLLSDDPNESVRATCARCLGELKDAEAAPLLEDAFQAGGSVQIQAVIALGVIGSESSIPALLAQLRNPAPEVRLQACTALGLIGQLKNTEPIESLLEDKDAMVRRGAEASLEKLGAKVKSSRWSRNAKRQMKRLGTALVPDSLLSILPGGNAGLIAVGATVVLAIAVYSGIQAVSFVSAPGAGLAITRIASVAVNDSGDIAYASRGNGVIDVWNLKDGTLTDRFKPQGRYSVLSNTTGDKALFYGNQKAVIFDRTAGFSEATEANASQIPGITGTYQPAEPDKLWVASNDESGSRLSLINRTNFSPEKQINVKEKISGVFAINPDQSMVVIPMLKGLKLLVGAELTPAPKLLELSRLIGKKQVGTVHAASFNQSGQQLALACDDAVVVIELPSGKLVNILFEDDLARAEQLISVRFTGEGNDLIAYSNKGGAYVAKDDYANTSTSPSADSSLMEFFSVSADRGTMVYARPTSKDLVVADLKTGQIQHELKGKQ